MRTWSLFATLAFVQFSFELNGCGNAMVLERCGVGMEVKLDKHCESSGYLYSTSVHCDYQQISKILFRS